jgi:hypothetical protein
MCRHCPIVPSPPAPPRRLRPAPHLRPLRLSPHHHLPLTHNFLLNNLSFTSHCSFRAHQREACTAAHSSRPPLPPSPLPPPPTSGRPPSLQCAPAPPAPRPRRQLPRCGRRSVRCGRGPARGPLRRRRGGGVAGRRGPRSGGGGERARAGGVGGPVPPARRGWVPGVRGAAAAVGRGGVGGAGGARHAQGGGRGRGVAADARNPLLSRPMTRPGAAPGGPMTRTRAVTPPTRMGAGGRPRRLPDAWGPSTTRTSGSGPE